MTTHLALAEARHQQAVSTLADAQTELLAAMRAVEPTFDGSAAAMRDRHWEAKLEGRRPLWELGQAYATYRRCQRAEAKARTAAHLARMAPVPAPATPPARRPRKAKKTTLAAHVREMWAEEAEQVAA